MVWGVCHRTLRNHHDAEDAFQATFLVLVRKAASIYPPAKVANWLYGVARQTALKTRATRAKQRGRERPVTEMPEPAVTEPDLWSDLQPLLDQELSQLPEKYRTVILLCELEGKTKREAARQLGLPEGTVASRVARARTMLAKRLARHGLAVSGGTLAAMLSQKVASAGVPTSVMTSTIKAVTLVAANQAVAAGVISPQVAALTEGVLKIMLLTKLKIATAVVLLVAATLCGVAGLVYQSQAGETQVAQQNQGQPGNTPGSQPKRVAPPASSSTIHGPTKDGLAAFIFAPRNKIKLGDDIPIFHGIMLTESDKIETRKIWPVHLAVGHENRSWFTVTGPDGKDLPSIAPAVEWPVLNPNEAVTLHPGEFHGRVCSNLAVWHKLTKPGVYTITWTHHVEGPKGPWSGRLVSNEIQVELVP